MVESDGIFVHHSLMVWLNEVEFAIGIHFEKSFGRFSFDQLRMNFILLFDHIDHEDVIQDATSITQDEVVARIRLGKIFFATVL